MAYRRNQKRKVQESFEAELVQGERHNLNSEPHSTLLLWPGMPVRISRQGSFMWGMPPGKYKGVVEEVSDGDSKRITDVTGKFIRVRLTSGPALVGGFVYFARWRLIRLPTNKRRP